MRAKLTGLGSVLVLALGLGGFVATTGSAAADTCKEYIKANYQKAQCDYNAHQMMMHKAAPHKKMAAKKMMMHKKKKPA